MNNSPLSKEKRERAIYLLHLGLTHKVISERLGITGNKVMKIAMEEGILRGKGNRVSKGVVIFPFVGEKNE